MIIETVPIDSISLDPANARKHPQKNLDAICGSLKRFGQQKPIVVDRNGVVRAGNGTLMAATAIGWKEIKIVRSELPLAEMTAFAISDNRTAELAEWDEEVLLATLADPSIGDVGFDDQEIRSLDAELNPKEIVEDEVPASDVPERCKPGNLWILGDHRLLCGDSTSAKDVARLMDGQKVSLCFTSPPYNAGDNKLGGNKNRKDSKYIGTSDDRTNEEYLSLLVGFTSEALKYCKTVAINIQSLAGNKTTIIEWIHDFRDHLVDRMIWNKGAGQPAIAKNVLNSRFEDIFIFSPDKSPSRAIPTANFHGTVSNVYEGKGASGENVAPEVHAATMPMHLASFALQTFDGFNGTVYEPFCGTGTTLIAAEQMQRKCFAMELVPKYCDIVIERWQRFTGKTAQLEP